MKWAMRVVWVWAMQVIAPVGTTGRAAEFTGSDDGRNFCDDGLLAKYRPWLEGGRGGP